MNSVLNFNRPFILHPCSQKNGGRNLFGQNIRNIKEVNCNIYADEIQKKICPKTGHEWFYIGLLIEDASHPFLNDIKAERYMNNNNPNSEYFQKNDRIMHWVNIKDFDSMYICKRWFEYIIRPDSRFYSYILGIDNTNLNRGEFDKDDEFNSKYNRFFRSAILYALKVFFPESLINVKNIFHEEGQQKYHKFFPWHAIMKIQESDENISFSCDEIEFLPKSHRENEASNLIQLCDCFMGACVNIYHGLGDNKRKKYYKAQLLELLLKSIYDINKKCISSHYDNRILIRFFPKSKTNPGDIERSLNQFYYCRDFLYLEEISGQRDLFNK